MKTFLEIFEKNVRKFGTKTALKDTGSGTVLTYEDLDRRSGQAAALFMQKGVRRSGAVAIVLPRGIDAVVSMIAAMKTGAVFAVLNENYPQERLETIYKDCGAKLVVSPQLLK